MRNSKGDPYGNHISIGVSYAQQSEFAFLCEAILDGLATVATLMAPELLPEDVAWDENFETICGVVDQVINHHRTLPTVSEGLMV